MDNKKCVVLCSGGMDSVTALAWAVHNGYDAHVLFVNYAQRTVSREQDYSRKAAERLGASWKEFHINLGELTHTSLIHEEGGTEVQGRNTILVGLATAYAQTIQARTVVIGVQTADVTYGDARPEWVNHMSEATKVAYNVEILAPLLYKNKTEIIQLAKELTVNLSETYSCYYDSAQPCGRCPSCLSRSEAEKQVL